MTGGVLMELWKLWCHIVLQLRPAFPRFRTFLWFTVAVCGFCTRTDLFGVSSFVRCLGLEKNSYNRLLSMFHCSGIDFCVLRRFWVKCVLFIAPGFLWEVNGRIVLLADGVKNPKSGHKMPGVKKLHQESESNTKPEYIFGHNLQAVGIVLRCGIGLTALLLGAEIHDGLVFSNRCTKTLLDKMLGLIDSLGITIPAYYVLDAYYGAEKMISGALRKGAHLITRVRSNAVAYLDPDDAIRKKGRGRRRKYGEKIKLNSIFNMVDGWTEAECMIYGSRTKVSFMAREMFWRQAGRKVLFVFARMCNGKKAILLSTDTSLAPLDVIELYSARFRIEVGFKVAIRIIGALGYHFWMKDMKPIGREGKNQYLHRESEDYRQAVRRKVAVYHNFMQCGIIAQGTMTLLSVMKPDLCWKYFGSWMRTMKTDMPPSEWVVSHSLRNTLSEFLADPPENAKWVNFLNSKREKGCEEAKAA